MDTVTIRQAINTAKNHERATGQLASLLDARAEYLHHAIQLPTEHIVPVLLNFVMRYIDHVPEFVDAVDTISNEAGLGNYIEPVMTIAKDFFSQPPELIRGHEGLNALMDEAYLAHRLIEEMNDRFVNHSGLPLIPMDMTRSNLIIHQLISEPFANQLDHAIHLMINQLESFGDIFSSDALVQHLNKNRTNWAKELKKWPCLVDSLAIRFSLNSAMYKTTYH